MAKFPTPLAGNYVVFLDNGVTVTARLSGKMKKFKIRILVGDRVTVGVSPTIHRTGYYPPTKDLKVF